MLPHSANGRKPRERSISDLRLARTAAVLSLVIDAGPCGLPLSTLYSRAIPCASLVPGALDVDEFPRTVIDDSVDLLAALGFVEIKPRRGGLALRATCTVAELLSELARGSSA
jgi:hypothetical protein